MNKKKKTIIIVSIVLAVVLLVGAVPAIYFGTNKVVGTSAAKILLARENMNNADDSFDWQSLFESTNQQFARQDSSPLNAVRATSNRKSVKRSTLSSDQSAGLGELVHDSPAGKVYKQNGEYNFQNISGASQQGLVVESRLFNIDYRVENAAKNINYLKNDLNIVNKWVRDGHSKFYLDVNSNKETLIEYYEDTQGQKSLWVVERETRADANSVYSLMYTDMQSGSLYNPVYILYIPDERYEYYYGHEGNSTDYLIAEKDKGYWNVFMPDKNDYSSVIVGDNFAFQSSGKYDGEGDDYGTVSTIDLKEDLITHHEIGLNVHLSAFDGVKGIYAPEQSCYVETYDGGEKSYIAVDYQDMKKLRVELNSGGSIKYGDVFDYGGNKIEISDIYFNFYTNPGFADPQYSLSLTLDMGEGLSLSQKLSLFEAFLNDNGLTCKYGLDAIESSILKNSEIANSTTSFYTWNGYLMNSSTSFDNGEKVIFDKIDALYAEYENVKGAEEVGKLFSAKVAKRQDFAKTSGLTLDTAAYSQGKIQIGNLSLTVEKSKLLENDKNYRLQIGLARIDENGKPLSQNTVNLQTNDTVLSKAYAGDALTLNASGVYDIPTALEEGRYVVVAYAVTEDEGIRVSQMQSIAFVDTVNDTIETDVVKINIQTKDNSLIVEYTTKLYFNVTLSGEVSYSVLKRAMMQEALKHGYPMHNEEITASNGTAVGGGMANVGEYRLKFVVPTIDGYVTGYVICTVE